MVSIDMMIGQEEKDALVQLALRFPIYKSRTRKVRIFAAVVAVASFVFVLLDYGFWFRALMAAATIFFVWYAVIGYKWAYSRSFKKIQRSMNERLVSNKHHYELDSQGITSTSNVGKTQNNWEAFEVWGIYHSYVYIRRFDGGIVLIDQRLLVDSEREELFDILKAAGVSRDSYAK